MAKKSKSINLKNSNMSFPSKSLFTFLFFLMGFSIVGAGLKGQEATAPIIVTIGMLMILIGLYFLRPGFIEEQTAPSELPELVALKEKPSPPPIVPVEDEMPDVKPPVPDASSIEELRALLVELAIPAETVNVILAGGFKTVTDLVATSPEQFASLTGLEARAAQDIHLAVQKKVWFGGI